MALVVVYMISVFPSFTFQIVHTIEHLVQGDFNWHHHSGDETHTHHWIESNQDRQKPESPGHDERIVVLKFMDFTFTGMKKTPPVNLLEFKRFAAISWHSECWVKECFHPPC